MKELAGGEISSDITDIYPAPIEDFRFDVSFARIDALIGKHIPEETVRAILAALEVKVLDEKDGVLSVAVPPYRVDVQREADLIEDILRIYGYNNVEIPSRVRSTLSYAPKPDRNRLMNLAADYLSANGFTEIMSNSLTRAAYYEGLESYRAENCVRILNPLSADLSVMRQTLLFNMLEAVQLNANRRNGDLKLYEFGNCYFYDEAKRSDENPLAAYSEEYRLAIAVTGIAKNCCAASASTSMRSRPKRCKATSSARRSRWRSTAGSCCRSVRSAGISAANSTSNRMSSIWR